MAAPASPPWLPGLTDPPTNTIIDPKYWTRNPPTETTERISRENAGCAVSAPLICAANRANPAETRRFARATDGLDFDMALTGFDPAELNALAGYGPQL